MSHGRGICRVGLTRRCSAAGPGNHDTHAGSWRSRGYAAVVAVVRVSVEAWRRRSSWAPVEAPREKQARVAFDCRKDERQTQHKQWLAGRQRPPRVVRGVVVKGRASEVCGSRQTRAVADRSYGIDAGRQAVLRRPRAVPDAAGERAERCCGRCGDFCAQRDQKSRARRGRARRGLQRACGLREKDVVGEDASQVLGQAMQQQQEPAES